MRLNSADARLKPGEDGEHHTFCRICEAVCGLTATVENGRVVKIGPDRANPHSRGHLCVKGPAIKEVTYDADRVTVPLKNIGGRFIRTSWDEALDDIADRLSAIIEQEGGDGVAEYLGNPSAFSTSATTSVRPFLAHFGIWKIFSAATQDITPRMVASSILYGSAFRMAIPDLPRCDFLLMLGANPLVSHGSILTAPRIREDLDEIANRGAVIVVDPRKTETADRYEHVRIRPDTDAWLLAAMLHTLFEECLVDQEALGRISWGSLDLRRAIDPIAPEVAEAHCGIPADEVRMLARRFAAAAAPVAYGRTGICRGRFSTIANLLLDALNIATGRFGQFGGWVFGDSPMDIAAVRPSGFEMRDTRFGRRPYVCNYLPFGQLVEEIMMPGKGQVRALFVHSGNVMLSAPGGEKLREALQSLDLFVSFDLYQTETNKFADYILPGTTFIEREDVPLVAFPHAIRPYAQYTDAVVPPEGEARDDHVILNDLGQRLHERLRARHVAHYTHDSAPVFNPMATIDMLLLAGNASDSAGENLSIDYLKSLPHGTMIADNLTCTNSIAKIRHADGRIRLWDETLVSEFSRFQNEPVPKSGELRLFSQRSLKSINSWMHNVDRLVRSQDPALLINPVDAAKRGLADGDWATISTNAGEMDATVLLTEDVTVGAVCFPHGWGHAGGWQVANRLGGGNVNVLADLAPGDLISGSSFLDGIPVSISAAVPG